MLTRTILTAAAAVVMCGPAMAQIGTDYYNNKPGQDTTRTDQTMRYNESDRSNMSGKAMWMKDVYMSVTPRDKVVLQRMLHFMPGNEEAVVRKVLQTCHMGNETMFNNDRMMKYDQMMRDHQAMSQGSMRTRSFMMSDADVMANTLDALTPYERRSFSWTWANIQPSEREALINALRACHEHHLMSRHRMSNGR